jgi:hypothetical protein
MNMVDNKGERNMLLNPTAFSTKEFSFKNKLFTAEISTLSQGGKREVFGRVYDDACDEGITLVSEKTGERIVFVVDDIDYNGPISEREVGGWRLKPAPEGVRGNRKHLADLRMLIIND